MLKQIESMLATDRWRGLEQATTLAVGLDHKPVANRLVELLEHKRSEVLSTAGWGLRRLAVRETLPAMLRWAKLETEKRRSSAFSTASDEQVSQIFQAFAAMDYRNAEPLLRQYIPKQLELGVRSRSAAIWALGHFFADNPQPDLAQAFAARLKDNASLPAEEIGVRQMSAVALGRMKAETEIPVLQQFLAIETVNGDVGYCCAWALRRLTGKPIAKRDPVRRTRTNWFLKPTAD